ncbi:aminoglycoside phosphotransferase family protein [Roseomonas sp. CCTCC AB2023176]|uniref:aminoglycoside phosphotransferase family protein n=1 Tax=Roseomonas sp. CCTCC AB2023176 TaxID=3342640 RepID=UPI0035D6AA17
MVIDATLVRRLIAAQFPRWSHLAVTPVEPGGWDNRTFRLGEGMSVRMPSAASYAPQVEKEHRWLPVLAPLLPQPVPLPLAKGQPGEGYPWPWSVYRWLPGQAASSVDAVDLAVLAEDLAGFLVRLQSADPTGGPPPGSDNFHRGGSLAVYDDEVGEALARLRRSVDTAPIRAMWDAALGAAAAGPPVWVHGDVSAGNLLLAGGRLAGVIDFGGLAVGDPACDLAIAWTLFRKRSRAVFRAGLGLADAAWARGRGWALWKAVIVLAELPGTDHRQIPAARNVMTEILNDRR